jgi:hypothetical protein
MNRNPIGDGDWIAYAFHAVPGAGKIKVLDVVVLDSGGNLVEETGGFHLVEVCDGRVTPKKVKQFVKELTEGFLRAEGIDVELPLENIRLTDLDGLSAVLARADSQKYESIRDLR